MSIESGLAACFKQAVGPSVAGVSWLVRIEHGGQAHHARANALFATHAGRATRRDNGYRARTTMQYLAELIDRGWNPAQEHEHTIEICDPPGAPARPWWRLW